VAPKAVIFGCAGLTLRAWERDFFARQQPFGFILFQRNCQDPAQVRTLVGALRESIGRADAPVLIDQEGGRVARLKPPHWRAAPAAARFGVLAKSDPDAAREAVRLNARLLADELLALGITVDCAPVLDLPVPGGHDVIGDRAFCRDVQAIAALGRAFCDGLLEGGVLPVIKHIPGHGRAMVDSHHSLPVVTATRAALEASDFATFRALADAPWAMTGHVVYTDIDPDRPATTSRRVIDEIVRGQIGFDGVLVSDDLSMQALAGGLGERAAAALAAGCDLALHCNGEPDEMTAVAGAVGPLGAEARRRIAAAADRLGARLPFDATDAGRRLDALLGAA
jgi:beta-N-acetylhexosaminidase